MPHYIRSKTESDTKTHVPWIKEAAQRVGVGDGIESTPIGEIRTGISEMRRISNVKRFGPELHLQPFINIEVPVDTAIQVGRPWPAQGIEAGIAKGNVSNRSERSGVEIGVVNTIPDLPHGLHPILYLCVSGAVARSTRRGDGERQPEKR
jgi:hypothetical protein